MFWIEPMFAKMILPMLGGTPSVWNTCIAFYQVALLAGYVYAHLITKCLEIRHQAIFHLGLLLLVFVALPIAIVGLSPPVTANPIPWLFLLLLGSVGLPFFVISATAPILQKWFTSTGHPSAKDPYFLYSASNLGSMVALLSYPFLLEPLFPLTAQSKAWSGGYTFLVLLILICAIIVWRSPKLQTEPNHRLKTESPISFSVAQTITRLKVSQRMRWVLLAFAPSSLLLGVTNHISIDIAQIPLLWIIPLAIYLLTFIFVFAPKPILSHRLMLRVQPFLLIPLMIPFYWGLTIDWWFIIPFHLLLFFVTAMVCHGELVNSRPAAIRLTEFYLWLSVGGVLGGLFNALIAPMVFNTLAEYPLMIAFACLLRSPLDFSQRKRYQHWLDLGLPLVLGMSPMIFKMTLGNITRLVDSPRFNLIIIILISCWMGCLLYSFRNRSIRFGAGIGAVMLASFIGMSSPNLVLYSERNFFGIFKVVRDPPGDYHLLYHGTTLHGAQSLNPARRQEPLTYYHPTGPIGQVFKMLSEKPGKNRVAIIGLGAGTIACYGKPGQYFTFYEIDPAIERIARDKRYFTFLLDSPARVDVVLGDARLSLAQKTSIRYDLMVLDAFSSDAIPVHLMTREALNLYLSKLADDGILAFHITNRYLDLKPVLGDLAQGANLACLVQEDKKLEEIEKKAKKAASIWVVMSRKLSDLGELASDHRWKSLQGLPGTMLWTDDFSNIPSVFVWSSIKIPIERIGKVF
jgi:hypothetical protein